MSEQPSYVNVATAEASSTDLAFTVDRDSFADAVAWAAKNLPNRPTVPVLAGVLLSGDGTELTVSAYDYEVSGRASLNAEIKSPGSALVSGRLLDAIARALPAKPVRFETNGTRVSLTCGAAKFTLPTMEIETYPALPILPDETGTVESQTFVEAVSQVVVAASNDDTTPMLTGVRMEFNGRKVKLIATDRFRLAVRELEWNPKDENVESTVLVPAKTLADVGRSGPDGEQVHLSLGALSETAAELFGISSETKRSTTRLLNADFPAYERLLRSEHTTSATVDVQELNEAVKRVALVCDRGAQIRLQFDQDGLHLSAGADEVGDANEDLECEVTGEPLTIAFQPAYLCDGLAALHCKTMTIGLTDNNKPAVLQASSNGSRPDFTYVLMPVRMT